MTNEGIGAIIQIIPHNLGRYSTMNPNEVMYGDHRPRVSNKRAGVFIADQEVAGVFYTDPYKTP